MHTFICTNCGATVEKEKLPKTPNKFCGSGCSAVWTNKHRSVGTKTSRIERWIKPRLLELFPDLEIHFNRKDAIDSELDIYVPEFRLGIELNGELHYKPVFSEAHLKAIQKNDKEKQLACIKSGIELITVDTSAIKYLTTKRGHRYLRMIQAIIDQRRNNT